MNVCRATVRWVAVVFVLGGVCRGGEPAFTETVVVDFVASAKACGSNGAVSREVVPDPLREGSEALRVTYPASGEGGGEWPALTVPTPALATTDWSGADFVVLRVLNPRDTPVDIGLLVAGEEARHGPHVLLQPNVWNAVAWPLETFRREMSVDKIRGVHVFLPHPPRETALFLRGLSLVRERDAAEVAFGMPLLVAGFEAEEELAGWQANGVSREIVTDFRTEGAAALRLVFPAWREGTPRWPSLQARYLDGSLPVRDWSGYDRLAADFRAPGDAEVPLRVYVKDFAGKTATAAATVAAGEELRWSVELGSLGLDLARIAQVDFFLTEPAASHAILLDNLRLEGDPVSRSDALLERLDRATAESAASGEATDVARGKLTHTANILRAARTGFREKPTLGGARVLDGLARAVGEQSRDLFRELDMARLVSRTRERVPGAAFGVGIADSMVKVMIRDCPLEGVTDAGYAEIALARGEWEAFQVVVTGASASLAGVCASPGVFRHAASGDELPSGAVASSVVGYVKTEQPPYDVSYVGWWPDPILDFQHSCAVGAGEAVPFWIRVGAAADAAAGIYEGSVTVRAEGCAEVPIPVRLRVFDFALPSEAFLPTACSFYDNIRTMWGREMGEAEYEERLTACAEFLARHRLDLDHIYRRPKDDPAALGLPLAQLRLLRDRGQLRRFMIFHVATPRKVVDPEDPKVTETIELCLRNLEYWVPRLRQEGLLEYAYLYGYDEVPAASFPVIAKVFGAIRAACPGVPLMTTAYDHSFGLETELGGIVDCWVPLTPRFDPERVARAREAGMDVWWYICVGPRHPHCNWFIEYPAIEARLLMGAMTAKYRPGGFLYYALTRWPENRSPITSGPYTDWNPRSYKTFNGDGSLFCAGPGGLLPTIRSENFRDGMEDYAYAEVLRGLVERAASRRGRPWRLRGALRRARQATEIPPSVVTSLTEYTHDPAEVRAMRLRLAESIEELRRLLD